MLDHNQWCIAQNGGGYTQRAVEKGLKVPCLFMINEVSIRCQKNLEVAILRIPAYTPPQYTTDHNATDTIGDATAVCNRAFQFGQKKFRFDSIRFSLSNRFFSIRFDSAI